MPDNNNNSNNFEMLISASYTYYGYVDRYAQWVQRLKNVPDRRSGIRFFLKDLEQHSGAFRLKINNATIYLSMSAQSIFHGTVR